jgi:predicted transcriptional regulator
MTRTFSDTEHTETPPARVGDLMIPTPLVISPETSVQAASRLMQEQRLRYLPVCEDGRWLASSASATCGWCCPRPPPALLLMRSTTC